MVKSRFILGKSIGEMVAAVIQHPDKYTGLLGLSAANKPHSGHAPSSILVALLKVLDTFAPELKQIFDPKSRRTRML